MSLEKFETVTLADVSINNKGEYGIGASAVDYSEELYTYLRITDINDDGTLNKNDLKSVDDEDAKNYLLKENDVVFARTGNSTGKAYYYDKMDGELVYAGFLIKFSLDPLKINPKFMKYYVLSEEYKGWVNSMCTGSTRPNINAKMYGNMELTLPSREQQDFLVSILDKFDKKIEINKRINKNLYGILLNYFNKIFAHENKNGKISDIVNIRRGASPRPIIDYISDTGINWLKISDVTGTEMPFIYKIKEKIIEKGKSKSVFIEKGTLVVSNSATPGIPKFIMVDTCVHDGWLVLNEYEDKLRYYLYFLIVKIRRELINLAYGSVFNNLKTDTLKNYEISKPDDNQLDKFNKIANPIMEKIDSNTKEIMMLSKLRDTLLTKLMSGEIDVSKINCDILQL